MWARGGLSLLRLCGRLGVLQLFLSLGRTLHPPIADTGMESRQALPDLTLGSNDGRLRCAHLLHRGQACRGVGAVGRCRSRRSLTRHAEICPAPFLPLVPDAPINDAPRAEGGRRLASPPTSTKHHHRPPAAAARRCGAAATTTQLVLSAAAVGAAEALPLLPLIPSFTPQQKQRAVTAAALAVAEAWQVVFLEQAR